MLKCTKFDIGWELGELIAPPRPLAGFKGPTSKGRAGRRGKGRERERKGVGGERERERGREGKGMGWEWKGGGKGKGHIGTSFSPL